MDVRGIDNLKMQVQQYDPPTKEKYAMDAAYVKQRANRISEQLQMADNVGR